MPKIDLAFDAFLGTMLNDFISYSYHQLLVYDMILNLAAGHFVWHLCHFLSFYLCIGIILGPYVLRLIFQDSLASCLRLTPRPPLRDMKRLIADADKVWWSRRGGDMGITWKGWRDDQLLTQTKGVLPPCRSKKK